MTTVESSMEGVEIASSVTTPSGLVIDYSTKPKRQYYVDRVPVPSVTQVIDELNKGGLSWWGMRVGIKAVIELLDRFETLPNPANPEGPGMLIPRLRFAEDNGQIRFARWVIDSWQFADAVAIEDLVKAESLTVNDIKDEAAERGQTVHDAFERWCVNGDIPNPEEYVEDQQGYVTGLVAFLQTMGDNLTVEGAEVKVGSAEHGFAGRYDCRARLGVDTKVYVAALTQKGEPLKTPKQGIMPCGGLILDLKTTKSIYPSQFIQTEAYEGASIESGYDPTDYRAILHVTSHGLYELRMYTGTLDDFLPVLSIYNTIDRIKGAIKV